MNKIDISVVIRTYNEEKYISHCISSILNQNTELKTEIIVVDSGSTDKTLEICETNRVRIIKISKSEFTYGYSLNCGISESNGRYIVVISAHCIPLDDNWLTNLVSPLHGKEAQLVFGAHKADPNSRCSEFIFFEEKYNKLDRHEPIEDHFNNGNSAFVKSLWEIEKFDEIINAQEDVVFSRFHVIKNGAIVHYAHNAKVIHYHNYSNIKLFKRIMSDSEVNFKLGIQKNQNTLSGEFIKLCCALKKDFLLAKDRGVVLKAAPGILCFRIMQVSGAVVGFFKYKKWFLNE